MINFLPPGGGPEHLDCGDVDFGEELDLHGPGANDLISAVVADVSQHVFEVELLKEYLADVFGVDSFQYFFLSEPFYLFVVAVLSLHEILQNITIYRVQRNIVYIVSPELYDVVLQTGGLHGLNTATDEVRVILVRPLLQHVDVDVQGGQDPSDQLSKFLGSAGVVCFELLKLSELSPFSILCCSFNLHAVFVAGRQSTLREF